MLSKYGEEYLKAIYSLTENGKPAKTTDLANFLSIAPATVTEMLQKLSKRGLVDYKPYYGAMLTDKGLKIAKKITRRHRLLERFLCDILRLKKKEIHAEACKMEHTLSDNVEEALCRLLKHPEKCPDDDKIIPPCDKQISNCVECMEKEIAVSIEKPRKKELIPITNLQSGQKGTVAFIRGGRGVVQRLTDMGLTPGTEIELLKSAPFRGPIEVCVRGCKLAVGRGIAMKIFVVAG